MCMEARAIMKPLRYMVIFALSVSAVGCKVSKQDAELLERDLRIQEDEIYSLRDCVDTYQHKLEACRQENRALRQELAARGGSVDSMVPPSLDRGPAVDLGPAETYSPGAELSPPTESGDLREAPPFRRPAISPPDGAVPEGVPPDGARLEQLPLEEGEPAELVPAADGAMQGAAVAGESGVAVAQYSQPREGATRAKELLKRLSGPTEEPQIVDPVHDLEVTEITLNKMLTGGMNRDKRHGDEGVMVVVEPRNPKNQIVEAFGDISIVVLDPALEGEAARVARWDITSQELEHRFRNRQLGRGFQLLLPWPGDPPQHSTLHLFVRFVAADGRKLIVDRPLEIEPPGGAKEGGWVPATRSDFAAESQGPSLMPAPESSATGGVEQEADAEVAGMVEKPAPSSRSRAARSSDTAAKRAEPSPDGAESNARATARLARAPREEPDSTGKKQRPRWTPYR